MQLLLLLLLALAGGNEEALKDVRPMLEQMGGGETLRAIERAEEISSMLAARKGANYGGNGGNGGAQPNINREGNPNGRNGEDDDNFPLAPIKSIADGEIISRLSQYIATGC